ncbi:MULTISPECIES: hypothetical protein [unclassified Crocosphaera]|uniref:hypothetical protein n=1 Tax=unclassified Crocosphaera TaxID=2623705 RepID=UPI002B1F6CC2|nr:MULTISPECIES: hypothetical protein [unclassified Crocosphaera]
MNKYLTGISQVDHTLREFLQNSCSIEQSQAEKRLKSTEQTPILNWASYRAMRESGEFLGYTSDDR